jgi:hypothetical protein
MSEEETRLLTVTFGEGWSLVEEPTLPGVQLIDLPDLRLADGTAVHALFVRGSMNGYPTRLFFDRQLRPKAGNLNQTTHPFRGTVMYAHSINQIAATVPPHEAILAHLRMYQ